MCLIAKLIDGPVMYQVHSLGVSDNQRADRKLVHLGVTEQQKERSSVMTPGTHPIPHHYVHDARNDASPCPS